MYACMQVCVTMHAKGIAAVCMVRLSMPVFKDELNITVGSKDYARDWQQDQLAGADAPVGPYDVSRAKVRGKIECKRDSACKGFRVIEDKP